MFDKLLANLHFLAAMLLFIIGFYTMLTDSNLIKKVIGLNIMDTGIFLFFISLGYSGGLAGGEVNPLPSALIYGGLAAAVSLTAFGLAMIVRLYKYYGTIDADEIMSKRGEAE
ncbi:MAG: cation:proton antiporter subunit C [Eubacteriales bacterium]|nr:cation:proton antiporter subunit C [Eubacteriales bacterium]